MRKSISTICEVIADSMDEGVRKIIIFSTKAFDLVPHDKLHMKFAATVVDLRVVVWVKVFFFGRSQSVRLDVQLS